MFFFISGTRDEISTSNPMATREISDKFPNSIYNFHCSPGEVLCESFAGGTACERLVLFRRDGPNGPEDSCIDRFLVEIAP